jgi:TetR/AcrR family transcriptional regulator, regulator of cefoperazone and chloramphenicol sensitivity
MRETMPITHAGQRTDGRQTAEAVLQAAGRVFAEKGYDRATSKEICALAKANRAAVNYHFGGFDALYDAVLLRAHERVLSWVDLAAIAASPMAPGDKIKRLIELHMDALLGLGSHAWELRVVSRELVAPSPALLRLHANHMRSRMTTIDVIIAEIMGVPVDTPLVRQAAFCTMTPSLMLLIGSPGMVHTIAGSERADAADLPALVEVLAAYALAGIKALGALARSDSRTEETETTHTSPRRGKDCDTNLRK